MRRGQSPVRSNPYPQIFDLVPIFPDSPIARDPQTGNLIGGVRPPWIKVPSATYLTDHETGCGSPYDTKVPYTAERLKTLYGNYANYARRYERAERESIEEGYLLPEDAARIEPIASPADFEGTK